MTEHERFQKWATGRGITAPLQFVGMGVVWEAWQEALKTNKPSEAAQLIEAYRKEHGAEIEADAETADWIGPGIKLDELLDSAVFFTVLIEKHLAAERAKIEGEKS